MKNSGVVQQDAGDREGWRRRAVKGLAKVFYNIDKHEILNTGDNHNTNT